jgi:hypothetical protein
MHSAVWALSFISFFFLYPSTFNILEVAAVDKPKLHLWETGIMRITRHPQVQWRTSHHRVCIARVGLGKGPWHAGGGGGRRVAWWQLHMCHDKSKLLLQATGRVCVILGRPTGVRLCRDE